MYSAFRANKACDLVILGQANLVFPSYTIQRWQTVLIEYLVALLAALVNAAAPHVLNRLARAILAWNLASFVIIVVVLLSTNDHKKDGSFVFSEFQNFTGFGPAMATIVGIVQSLFGNNGSPVAFPLLSSVR